MKNNPKKKAEDLNFTEAIGLMARIKEKNMSFSQLKKIATNKVIFILRDQLEWIEAYSDEGAVIITETGMKFATEYHAMIVLRNIAVGNITKNKLQESVPKKVIELMEGRGYISYLKTENEFPKDEYVYATEKGLDAVMQYFNEE